MRGFIDKRPISDVLFSGDNKKLQTLYERMSSVVDKILDFVAYGIHLQYGLEDIPDLKLIHQTKHFNMRFLHYPYSKRAGVLRCGAHKDFGTITLLCQDNTGGLEVLNPDGQWEPIRPHPTASLWINFGICLEMLYGIPALVHRVVDPSEHKGGNVPGRNSAVLFVDPDRNLLLRPIKKYVNFTRDQVKHAMRNSSHRNDKKSLQESIMKTFEIDVVELHEEMDTDDRLDLAHEFEKEQLNYNPRVTSAQLERK